MAISGSGSAADPYVVDNYEDFIEKIGEQYAYVTCVDNLVFDMLDIYPNGILPTKIFQFNCDSFDGNGLIIKHLYGVQTQGTNQCIIDFGAGLKEFGNLKIMDAYITTSAIWHFTNNNNFTSGNKSICNFEFNGVIMSSSDNIYINGGNLFNCTFVIDYYNTSSTLSSAKGIGFTSYKVDSCWIRLNCKRGVIIKNGSYGTPLYNTYVEGEVHAYKDDLKLLRIKEARCSIFNVACYDEGYTGVTVDFESNISCLFNTSLKEQDVGYTTSSITLVTTQQLKDYGYLERIFPIVQEEEETT